MKDPAGLYVISQDLIFITIKSNFHLSRFGTVRV